MSIGPAVGGPGSLDGLKGLSSPSAEAETRTYAGFTASPSHPQRLTIPYGGCVHHGGWGGSTPHRGMDRQHLELFSKTSSPFQ